ncbi:ABC transporter permease [Burkholderia sp. WAC0059]|uniref:ABC transporter permease n=1 Tax=Burkholderia sp. WAC0059 TaxID=2066022 RepID=UPI000C7F085E|nr:ABC transporter permease [Burkholderia sp. WAC0059]PLZ04094.1 ABC transporter permease [Burkholderia sp. WAC0059]
MPPDEQLPLTFPAGGDSPARQRPSATASLWRYARPVVERSLAIVLFLLAWELAPRLGWVNRTFLPPFSEVVVYGVRFALSGQLFVHIGVSLGRALGGFALGVVTAVPLGILLAWYSTLDRYLNPLLQLFRQTNPVSLFPVFIMFFGVGYLTKVLIIYWVVVWPILLGTMAGVKYVDPSLVKYARSLSLRRRDIFMKVLIPSAIPSIISGMRLAATYSFLMLVISEMIGASSGLGYLVANAQYVMSIHILYVAVIVIALLGMICNTLLVRLEKRLTAWKTAVNPG